jgi:hypothetical protein
MAASSRQIGVYKAGFLVLSVDDRPGHLFSTAAPPPDGAPAHPFVNARAYDPFSEQDLATILAASTDYDSFLYLLIDEGYDLAASGEQQLGSQTRFVADNAAAGCLWTTPGPVAALGPAPDDGWPTAGVTVTRYATSVEPSLSAGLLGAASVEDARNLLNTLGFVTAEPSPS